MQNQESEMNCKTVREQDEALKKVVNNPWGFKVKDMKPYISSDLCIVMPDNDQGLPTINKCCHKGDKR